jgi:hypothetical protein
VATCCAPEENFCCTFGGVEPVGAITGRSCHNAGSRTLAL